MTDQPPSAPDHLPRLLFATAVQAVTPATTIPPVLSATDTRGRLVVLGLGKAAAAMARSVTDQWQGPVSGIVVTRHGYAGAPIPGIQLIEAGHPVPDQGSVDGALALMQAAESAQAGDTVMFLVSGGGSALAALPAHGIGLAEKQAVTRALLASGAGIGDINTIRKHLSRFKGGRLARAAWPARLITLAISDVPGDDPSVIASGPTVADPSTYADARAILDRFHIDPGPAITAILTAEADESPKPGDSRLAQSAYHLVARPRDALDAASALLTAQGYEVVDLGDRVEGEARDIAAAHARMALDRAADLAAGQKLAIISGGELTVTLNGNGIANGLGGRNREYLLAMAMELNRHPAIQVVAGGTDGADGTPRNDGTDVAGAVIGPWTLDALTQAGIDPAAALSAHDAGSAFSRIGADIITGGTGTNVSDFRAILIQGR